MEKTYSSKDILVLEGLSAVRMRPGMYIGTTGIKGMHHLLWEIVDNAIDELSNGFGNRLVVTLNTDGSASVEDDGRGIPVDMHPQLKVSGVEVVFTQLHAGGKFNSNSYGFAGGLHGVGASVANALSTWLECEVYKGGKTHFVRFEAKKDDSGKIHYGQPVAPLTVTGKTDKTGTKVTFSPDRMVFKYCQFHYDTINAKLREKAFLNKGIEMILIDNRVIEDGKVLEKVYKYDGGIADYVCYLNEAKDVLFDKPIYLTAKSDMLDFECALQYTDAFAESVFSYVNNIPTSEGGTHETGFKTGFTKVLNDLARKYGYLKDKELNFMGEDFREGLTAVLTVKMRDVQFEGQTKTKLGNPEVKAEVERFVISTLNDYFNRAEKDANQKKLLEIIMNKAKGAAKVREASRHAKELARKTNSLDSSNLIGKLSACTGKRPELNELFIVEGDSAGGTAKQARDRSFQAILPLRGKPLNAEKKRIAQVLENEEFRTIISALGTSIGEDLNLDNLKYHKVIILADADQDGAHIRSILLTFLFRYMKELINNGHVYIGMPPLYKVSRKDFSKYAYNDEELAEITKDVKGTIQRYKGLGEMNADQLWETTMNPKARKMVRVTIEDAAQAELMVTTLMGDNIEARKAYISEHANFNKVDNFSKIGGGAK